MLFDMFKVLIRLRAVTDRTFFKFRKDPFAFMRAQHVLGYHPLYTCNLMNINILDPDLVGSESCFFDISFGRIRIDLAGSVSDRIQIPVTYNMSKKQVPILYSNLLYKTGNYFLDRQYNLCVIV